MKRWALSSQTPTEESISDSEQTGLMVLSPDRTRLALSHGKIVDVGTPTRVELYSLTPGEPPRRFRKGTASQDIIAGMTYLGTNRTLVAADFQGYLVFIGEDNSQPTTMEAVPHSSIGQLPLGSVAASPSGDLLATGDKSGLIRLWDAHTRSLIRTLPGHNADVRALTFSPQAERLASASFDGSLRMWDITTNGTATAHPCPGGGWQSSDSHRCARGRKSGGGSKKWVPDDSYAWRQNDPNLVLGI